MALTIVDACPWCGLTSDCEVESVDGGLIRVTCPREGCTQTWEVPL